MSKIQTIHIQNFKAIGDLEMNFNGATAIITGKNNSGKTSFLKGIVDRIRFIRPDVMVKQGEKEGRGELVLDSGEKFVWNFNTEGTDKLTYITEQGRKSVTKEFGAAFFPKMFDIDVFLQSSPKQQVEQLQKLVGLDFTEINKRYQIAYDRRTERNREAEIYHVKLEKMMRVDKVESVNLDSLKAKKKSESDKLNALYLENKTKNEITRKRWEVEKNTIDLDCTVHNDVQHKKREILTQCVGALGILKAAGFDGGDEFIESIRNKIAPSKNAIDLYPKEPTYIEEMPDRLELDKIDAELLAASETNAQAQKYQEYQDYKAETEAAKDLALEADGLVKNIEHEREMMINTAKFPEGITISLEGIIQVDGFPLDKNQISTSKLYTSALRIASMNMGEVKTLYFDASFLDKVSLSEICDWAEKQGYQLMIERPDYDAGEIKYELIEG